MSKGLRIKNLREMCGMGQTEAAQKVGVSKQTLYKYERDIITNIPSDIIEKLANLYGTTPEYIMGWSASPAAMAESPAPAASSDLRKDESELLSLYNSLNAAGKKEVRKYVNMIADRDEYKLKGEDSYHYVGARKSG